MLLYMIKRLLSVLIVAVFVPAQYRAESISAASDFPGYAIDKSTNPRDKRRLRVSDEATEAVDDERGIPPVIRESLASSSSGKRKFDEIVFLRASDEMKATRLKSARDANRFKNNQALERLLEKSGITADEVQAIASSILQRGSYSFRLRNIDNYKLELMVLGHEFFTQLGKTHPDWKVETLEKNKGMPIRNLSELRDLVGKEVKFDSLGTWQQFRGGTRAGLKEVNLNLAWFYFHGYDEKLKNEELFYMATGSEYFQDENFPKRLETHSAAKKKAGSKQPVPTPRNKMVPDPVQQKHAEKASYEQPVPTPRNKMVPDPGQHKHAEKASYEQPVPTPRIEKVPEIDLNIDAFVDHPEFKAKLDEFAEETVYVDIYLTFSQRASKYRHEGMSMSLLHPSAYVTSISPFLPRETDFLFDKLLLIEVIAPAPKDLYRKISMIPEPNATCEVGASHSVLSLAPAPLSVIPADHPVRTEKFDSIDT
ncbi:hypothetical protein PsorP6_001655 [Peronosclerospora sorghi]|uniref:Uncharacterized protein n=1 Tax=Peronosclerospora sorghi TaxID=230839 RepID=A0ACC0WZJ3_9STRA|nr:hypothetical protein PsorP6_001655 [Peronosclerospora sorghi]